MEITKEWLAVNNFTDNQISWFASQNETDAIKLVKKLLPKGTINFPDVAIEQDRALNAAFDLANNILTRLMDEKQLIKYAVFAVKQSLPYFIKDFPEEHDPIELFRLTKEYLKVVKKKNLIEDEEIYRKNIFQITCSLHAHADKVSDILLINHAVSLTAYSAIYVGHKPFQPTSHKVIRSNTVSAVNFSISYFDSQEQRDKMFAKVIIHGLKILERTHILNKKKERKG